MRDRLRVVPSEELTSWRSESRHMKYGVDVLAEHKTMTITGRFADTVKSRLQICRPLQNSPGSVGEEWRQ